MRIKVFLAYPNTTAVITFRSIMNINEVEIAKAIVVNPVLVRELTATWKANEHMVKTIHYALS